MRTLLGAALIATAMLVMTACSSATPRQVDIEIVGFAYTPEHFEVAVGEEVTWINQDDFAHTVTAGEPNEPTGAFDGRLGESSSHASSGATFTTTFDEAGTYAYFCDLHPSMTGEIVVTGS